MPTESELSAPETAKSSRYRSDKLDNLLVETLHATPLRIVRLSKEVNQIIRPAVMSTTKWVCEYGDIETAY